MKPMTGFERDTFAAAWKAKRLWATQFIGNAALFAVFYGWLHIPDARVWQLLLTGVVAVAGLISFLWLHSWTLAHFQEVHTAGKPASLRSVLPHLPAVLLAVGFFVGLEWLLGQVHPYVPQTAGYVHHTLPRAARAGSTPQEVLTAGQVVIGALRYLLIPLLMLPLMARTSGYGFRGIGSTAWLRRAFHWRWVILYGVALGVGWFLPVYLAGKLIQVSGVAAQAASLGLRFFVAYVLAVTAWICVASALGRLLAPSTDQGATSASDTASAV